MGCRELLKEERIFIRSIVCRFPEIIRYVKHMPDIEAIEHELSLVMCCVYHFLFIYVNRLAFVHEYFAVDNHCCDIIPVSEADHSIGRHMEWGHMRTGKIN